MERTLFYSQKVTVQKAKVTVGFDFGSSMKNLKFMENPSGSALEYKMKEYNKARSKNFPFLR